MFNLLPHVVLLSLFGPLMAFSALALACLFGYQPKEYRIRNVLSWSSSLNFLAAALVLLIFLTSGRVRLVFGYDFFLQLKEQESNLLFVCDTLSVTFLFLAAFLTGVVANFSQRYLHRERGQLRFVLLYLVFVAGINFVALAANLKMLLVGWELVGISSVLLIAYFQFRISSVSNAFVTLACYKVCDIGLLLSIFLWHGMFGGSGFITASANTISPAGIEMLPWFAFAILIAAFGKSAQLPFSTWLPRAMEGPTPSSAIFYGALSIHIGCFLLLRLAPYLELIWWAPVVLTANGLLTSLFAFLSGRVRADVKTQLAYATLAQCGLIMAEIGLGFTTLATVHIFGHAILRTLQFLSSASMIQVSQSLGSNFTTKILRHEERLIAWVPRNLKAWAYRQSLMAWNLDDFLATVVLRPFWVLTEFCQQLDHNLELAWTRLLHEPQPPPRILNAPAKKVAVETEKIKS